MKEKLLTSLENGLRALKIIETHKPTEYRRLSAKEASQLAAHLAPLVKALIDVERQGRTDDAHVPIIGLPQDNPVIQGLVDGLVREMKANQAPTTGSALTKLASDQRIADIKNPDGEVVDPDMAAFLARVATPGQKSVAYVNDFTVEHRAPPENFFDGPFGPGGWQKEVGDLATLRGRLGDLTVRIVSRNPPYWEGEIVTIFNLFAGASAKYSNYQVGQKIWFSDLHVIGVVRQASPA